MSDAFAVTTYGDPEAEIDMAFRLKRGATQARAHLDCKVREMKFADHREQANLRFRRHDGGNVSNAGKPTVLGAAA